MHLWNRIIKPCHGPIVENLESRTLLHAGHGDDAFHVHVNFQPANVSKPGEYLLDSGKTFGDRGNGYFYGWNLDLQSQTRDRNAVTAPGQTYDTLIHTQQGGDGIWEFELPNGQYLLHLVAGDASFPGDTMALSAEGQTVLQGVTTAFQRHLESQTLVEVTDGRLTIGNAPGAMNNKLNFLSINAAIDHPTEVKLALPDATASESGDSATARFTRFGPMDQPLTVHYKITGTADDGGDYDSLPGSIEIPAGAASTDLVIQPIEDDLLEPGETVEITLLAADGYAMRAGQFASITIADNENAEAQAPYFGTPQRLSATIQAEDFDYGPAGVAYNDHTSGNSGGYYRDSAVDIAGTTDLQGGFAVTQLRAGEWLKYTIDVPVAGTYRIETRVSSATKGGSFHIEFNGSNKTGSLTLPGTGSWETWKSVTKTGVKLSAGVQTMTLKIDRAFVSNTDVGSINWIRIYHDLSASAQVKWTNLASSPTAREEANGAVIGNKLYTIGGFHGSWQSSARVDIYDKSTNKWTRGPDIPEPINHGPMIVIDGKIWVVGGYLGYNPGPATSHVWIFDPATNTWSAGPELPQPRGAGAASLVGRHIHYFGGQNLARNLDQSDQWMFDLDNPDAGWIEKAPLQNPRNHFGSVSIGGKVYAVGGQKFEVTSLINQHNLDIYDPQTDTWSKAANLPLPLSHIHQSTIVRNGKILVLGGEVNHNVPAGDVLMYDPAKDVWSYLGKLPGVRRAGFAGLFGNSIVFNGGFGSGVMQKNTWLGTLSI